MNQQIEFEDERVKIESDEEQIEQRDFDKILSFYRSEMNISTQAITMFVAAIPFSLLLTIIPATIIGIVCKYYLNIENSNAPMLVFIFSVLIQFIMFFIVSRKLQCGMYIKKATPEDVKKLALSFQSKKMRWTEEELENLHLKCKEKVIITGKGTIAGRMLYHLIGNKK